MNINTSSAKFWIRSTTYVPYVDYYLTSSYCTVPYSVMASTCGIIAPVCNSCTTLHCIAREMSESIVVQPETTVLYNCSWLQCQVWQLDWDDGLWHWSLCAAASGRQFSVQYLPGNSGKSDKLLYQWAYVLSCLHRDVDTIASNWWKLSWLPRGHGPPKGLVPAVTIDNYGFTSSMPKQRRRYGIIEGRDTTEAPLVTHQETPKSNGGRWGIWSTIVLPKS